MKDDGSTLLHQPALDSPSTLLLYRPTALGPQGPSHQVWSNAPNARNQHFATSRKRERYVYRVFGYSTLGAPKIGKAQKVSACMAWPRMATEVPEKRPLERRSLSGS